MKYLVFDKNIPNELIDVLSFNSDEDREKYLKNNPGYYLDEVPDELDLEDDDDIYTEDNDWN